MQRVDWSLILVLAFEILAFASSAYRANSVQVTRTVEISVLLYYVIRLKIRTPNQIAVFGAFVGLGGALLSLSGMRRFAESATFLDDVGLTDLVAFRSHLVPVPIPWVPGEWFTVLLLTLPFACAPAVYFWRMERKWWAVATLTPAFSIAVILSLSLSRAVFWSTVLFIFVTCALLVGYRIIGLRTGVLLLGSALGVLIIVVACDSALYPDTFRVYVDRQTSQVRSTQGRISIWKRSLELVCVHPLWGVGSSNSALALTSGADREDTSGFASRTFSLPVQVLVEKGAVGFLLYSAFLCLVGREFHRVMRSQPQNVSRRGAEDLISKRPLGEAGRRTLQSHSARKAMMCCFAAGMLSVLAREITYSSLFEHMITLTLFFSLAALVCSAEPL